tara:strand:+ start:8815 stop:10044 length:1230 start_codon:yes stop_codon:yes gene_type:complete
MKLLSLLSLTSLVASSASAFFFTEGPVAPVDLPSDKLYPQGRIFPFGGFSGNVVRDEANGFTTYGPVYRQNDEFLDQVEDSDLLTIYSVGIDMNFHERNGEPKRILSDDEIREEITRQVEAVVDDERVAWWYLVPEEIRFWYKDELNYLEVASEAIRDSDPYDRPIWMYEPNHRGAEALMITSPFLDIVGKGAYVNYAGQKDTRVWIRRGMELQAEVIDDLRGDRISILVPEMFREPDQEDLPLIRDWVRHDVYLGLVEGAEGVIVYSLFPRGGFPSFPEYYAAYAEVAQELTGELGLGQVLLFGERRKDIKLKLSKEVPSVSPMSGRGGIDEEFEYEAVDFANIAYGKDRFLFLVNSGVVPAEGELLGIPRNAMIRDVFAGKDLPWGERAVTLSLEPLEVKVWRISQD